MIQIEKCNLCGNSRFKKILTGYDRQHKIDRRLFQLAECLDCGLIFFNPRPSSEELKKYYPEDYAPYHGEAETFKYGYLSNLIKKIFKSGPSVKKEVLDSSEINYLDFGCGSGDSLQRLREKHPNWNLYGLDNSDFACRRAREKGFKVYCGELEEIDLPENYFEVINLTQVIEHLPDPKNALLKLNKALKKGGRLIVQTPNYDSWAAKLFRTYWYGLDVPRHLVLFTPKTLSKILSKTGFSIKKIQYKDSLMVEIRSVYYLFNRNNFSINALVWKLTRPLSKLLTFFKQSSIITAYAEKK